VLALTVIISVVANVIPIVIVILSLAFILVSYDIYCGVAIAAPAGLTAILNVAALAA
jgi:hypothetical protein